MPNVIKNQISVRYIFACLLLISSVYTFAQTNPVQLQPVQTTPVTAKPMTIVLDAGHGGKDGSTRGEFSKEKDVALAVALQLGQTIQEQIPNAKVIFTRTEDVFIPLYERIDIANRAHA